MEKLNESNEFSLENVVSTAIQVPGVKVSRNAFLAEAFATQDVDLTAILELGPVEAGISRETLLTIGKKLILSRTSQSSLVSFVTGLPGGLAMAATIPADVLQFFGMTLRLAQELSYLYGAQDLWEGGEIDDERVRNQLILYCGAMFGVASAGTGVRLLSAQVAKTAMKKIPQKALTKTTWYPLVKKICAGVGIKITKTTVTKGVAKAIPVIGGVVSGTLNFASMAPMAGKLHSVLDDAAFDYTAEEMEEDIFELEQMDENGSDSPVVKEPKSSSLKAKLKTGTKNICENLSGILSNILSKRSSPKKKPVEKMSGEEIFHAIEKLAQLNEMGAITEAEFDAKKAELLDRL